MTSSALEMYERLNANLRASVKKYTRPGSAVGNAAALKAPIPQPTFKLASPATFPRRPTGHEVPRLMMTFWFGPPFKGPRLEAFNSLRRSVGVPLHLVTSDNLKQYVLPGYPLHPAFKFLTPVHKSDYLFGYFSHHVGGAFHDIKQPFGNWTPYFDRMERIRGHGLLTLGMPTQARTADEPRGPREAWLVGSPTLREHIACQEPMAADDPMCLRLRRSRGENASHWRSVLPEFKTAYINGSYDPFDGTRGACCERVRNAWKHMINCQEHIARPRTALTRDWLRLVHVALDRKLAALNATRYPMARCCQNHENGYPINWAELKGNTLFPLELKYQSHVYPILPPKPKKAYRSKSEEVPLHALPAAPQRRTRTLDPKTLALLQALKNARADRGDTRAGKSGDGYLSRMTPRQQQSSDMAPRGETQLLPAFRNVHRAIGSALENLVG